MARFPWHHSGDDILEECLYFHSGLITEHQAHSLSGPFLVLHNCMSCNIYATKGKGGGLFTAPVLIGIRPEDFVKLTGKLRWLF